MDIVLGEHTVKLAEENWDELKRPPRLKALKKIFYDLRHSLFIHESFVLPELKKETHAIVDLSRKHIANMEYCMDNTPHWDTSFYGTSMALVSLAGSYFNILLVGATSPDYEVGPEDMDRFAFYIEDAAQTAIDDSALHEEVNRRIFNMCTRIAKEFEEHSIEGHGKYNSNLRRICGQLRENERHRIVEQKKSKREGRH